MSNFLLIFLYFLSGFSSGIFGGMGMGGGTILIPILTIFFSLDQRLSQGINLISFLVMSLVALIIHYKNGFLSLNAFFSIYLCFSIICETDCLYWTDCNASPTTNALIFVYHKKDLR